MGWGGKKPEQGAQLRGSFSRKGRSGVSLINKGNSGGNKRKEQI